MKTAKEIREAIKKQEQEHIDWAKKVIDDASERMFSKTHMSERIELNGFQLAEFKEVSKNEDVKKFLEENGFVIKHKECSSYLEIKSE